jgi:ribosomal protein S18 acetylase RimI-like enzyme
MSDKSAVIIRGGTPADMEAAGKLGALLVRIHHEFDPQRFVPAMPGIEIGYASFLKSQLGKPDVIVLVAELGGEVVGYSYSGVEERDYMALRGAAGVIYDIVVDPAHRNQGIGSILLEATAKELETRGAPRIVLSTADKNVAAQRLFARAGFRRTMIEMTRELR